MNITQINTHNNYKKPSFTSCIRIYNPKKVSNLDIFSSDKIRTTSILFRHDEDWDLLFKYIFLNFSGLNKVNIYSLGCSDGSEPYTYALYLYNKTPESFYKKYTPIIACDIDPEIIKSAKSGKINLSEYDFNNMKKYIKNCENYFKKIGNPLKIKNNIIGDEQAYEIDKNIRKMVKFKKSDILTELKNIKDEGNTVVNIRNVFPYLNAKHIDEILNTISEKLKTGSIFVFGHYDNLVPNFRQRLHNLGFYSPVMNANFVQKI